MAETEQDRTVLPPRGAGLSAEAGETLRPICLFLALLQMSIHFHTLRLERGEKGHNRSCIVVLALTLNV